eukprot:6473517-Amphidinium_carterae.2
MALCTSGQPVNGNPKELLKQHGSQVVEVDVLEDEDVVVTLAVDVDVSEDVVVKVDVDVPV